MKIASKSVALSRTATHPLLLFFAVTTFNHLALTRTLELEADGKLLMAFINGIASDLLLPVILLFLISFLSNEQCCKLRNAGLAAMYSLTMLPALDYLYFSVTYSRFSWSLLHDLNIYSIKAMIGGLTFFALSLLTVVGCLMILAFIVSFRFYSRFDFMPQRAISKYLLYLIVVVKIFFPVEHYTADSHFSPVILPVMTKNLYLTTIGRGSVTGFLDLPERQSRPPDSFQNYSEQELAYLKKHGLLTAGNIRAASVNNTKHYSRIIMIVFESLALEYLHSFNKKIPAQTTEYFDYLINKYPHSKNFFTSDSPTINGFNALFNSRIPYEATLNSLLPPQSLVRLFKDRHNGKAVFIRGVSKFYGGENLLLKSLFGFDQIIAYEELSQKHPIPSKLAWGYSDDIVLAETLQAIRAEKNKPFFIVAKLIDQHQPPAYCGISKDKLPAEVAQHSSPIVPSVYWANYLLKNFIESCRQENLLNDNTLLIVTSDHYPPLGYGHQHLFDTPQLYQLGRLPLIFIAKNLQPLKNFVAERLSCQLDFAPTICELADLAPNNQFHGQNMLLPTFVERALGHFNGTIFWQNKLGSFNASLRNPEFPDRAVNKWLNNLLSDDENATWHQ